MALPGVKDWQVARVKRGGSWWYVDWQFWNHDRTGHVSVSQCGCGSKWGNTYTMRYRSEAKAWRHVRQHISDNPGVNVLYAARIR